MFADVNTQVDSGAKLLLIEPDADQAADSEPDQRADLDALAAGTDTPDADHDPALAAADALAALRSLVLGFDVDEAEARRQLQQLTAAHAGLPAGDPQLLTGEAEILQIFADVSALWRNRRVPDESQADDEAAVDAEAARNPQEYMHAYLRSRDADAEGLPESFRIKLRRTLAHYGVGDLDPSPDLDPALYRIFLAHRRAAAHVPVVSELLQWRLRRPDSLGRESVAGDALDGYRRVVDQLVPADPAAAPGHRRPGPADPLPLLRRPADRCRADPGPAAGARGTRPAVARPPGPGGADRHHRRLGRAHPGRLRRPASRRDAGGDDPAVLPDQAAAERRGHRAERPSAADR